MRSAALAVLATCLLPGGAVHAQTVWWEALKPGYFHDPANWSAPGPPEWSWNGRFTSLAEGDTLFGLDGELLRLEIVDGSHVMDLNGFTLRLTSPFTGQGDMCGAIGYGVGIATLDVREGTLDVHHVAVGLFEENSATLRMRTGSSLVSDGLVRIGAYGGQGVLMMLEGSALEAQSVNIGGVEASGTLLVSGGSTVTTTADVAVGAFDGGIGILDLSHGTISCFTLKVGAGTGTSGSGSIHGAASVLIASNEFVVGWEGAADMTLSQGASVTASLGGSIGRVAGSSGVLAITTGATLTAHNRFFVGGVSASPGIPGDLHLESDGALICNGIVHFQPDGVVHLAGGHLAFVQLDFTGGALDWTSGLLESLGSFTITDTGSLGAEISLLPGQTLRVLSRLDVQASGLAYVDAAGGTLHVGDLNYGRFAGSRGETLVTNDGVVNAEGDIHVGGSSSGPGGEGLLYAIDGSATTEGALVVHPQGEAYVGAGGMITAREARIEGGTVGTGGSLFLVTSDLTGNPSGGILVDGLDPTFLDMSNSASVSSSSGRIGTVGFGQGAVTMDGGAVWAMDAVLTIGTSDGTAIDAALDMTNSTVTTAAGTTVHSDGRLLMSGSLMNGPLWCAGVLRPNAFVNGHTTLTPTARTTFTLGGTDFAMSDRLDIIGTLVADGTLEILIDESLDVAVGDSYRLIVPDALVGGFEKVLVDDSSGVLAPLRADVRTIGPEYWVDIVQGADIDGDGLVGVTDLLIVLAEWGVCPDPSDCPADIDGDGSVGVGDLLAVLAAWS